MQHLKIMTISGDSFKVVTDESILNSALQNGTVFEYSCKSGKCGICKTKLLQGEVKEIIPQIALSKQDISEGKILTCCCEPVSDVLIDAESLNALQDIKTKTLPARIKSLNKVSSNIIKVKLRLPSAADFKYLEGQYIDIIVPNLARRSYSIANSSNEVDLSFLIKKIDKGILSDYWFKSAKENDLLRIEGPKGTFFLRDSTKDLVFLATGTGIAPIISILNKLDNDEEFNQSSKIALYLGNSSTKDFVELPLFNNIKIDYFPVLSKKNSDWKGHFGYVQDAASIKDMDIKNTNIYACGSNDMIISAKKIFLNMGIENKNFFSDSFLQNY